jgi:hypothetical protein
MTASPGIEHAEDRIVWRCLLCNHEWSFHAHDHEHVGFMIVYHLAKQHLMTQERIAGLNPSLRPAIGEFFRHQSKQS